MLRSWGKKIRSARVWEGSIKGSWIKWSWKSVCNKLNFCLVWLPHPFGTLEVFPARVIESAFTNGTENMGSSWRSRNNMALFSAHISWLSLDCKWICRHFYWNLSWTHLRDNKQGVLRSFPLRESFFFYFLGSHSKSTNFLVHFSGLGPYTVPTRQSSGGILFTLLLTNYTMG